MGKILISFLFFYILSLLEIDFLPFFNLGSWLIPLLIIVLISLFEKKEGILSYWSAFFGGLFLDLFSEKFFGFYILIFISLVIFIKLVLKVYVRPVIQLEK